jgi:dipeptidase E
LSTLLLTSTGLSTENLKNEFKKLFVKPLPEIKVVFIPTAARTEEEKKYVQMSSQELLDLGIEKENIIPYNCTGKEDLLKIGKPDCLYVCGGNTFYLLKKLKDSQSDIVIKNWVKNGSIYIGVSAGSIVAGPDIKTEVFDENYVGLTDLSGLNLTSLFITPHYTGDEESIIADIEKKTNYSVTRLRDNTAILLINEKMKLI